VNAKQILYIVLTGLAFGSSLVASRFGVSQVEPVSFVTARLILASLGFFAIYALDHRHHSWPTQPQLWRHSLVIAIFGPAIQMTAILLALQNLSSGMTSILVTTLPVFVLLMAHFFLPDEKLTPQRTTGVLLALAGALLLLTQQQSGLLDVSASVLGYGLVVMALLAAGISTIYTRKYMQQFDSFDVTSLRILTSAAIMIAVSVFWTGFDLQGLDGLGYLSLLYTTLVGVMLALLMRFAVIKRYGATSAAMINYVIPISATLGGVLLLDEIVTGWMVAGMAIILLGITLTTYNPLSAKRLHLRLR